jgi:predicted transcriptional regulator of viral defense system
VNTDLAIELSALSYHDITTQVPSSVHLVVPLEALRLARQRKRVQYGELLHCARLLRVESPMSPYLQAIE